MPETILVVDDEEDIREICAETLRDAGYNVHEAASAAAAMERLESGAVDVVLSDVRMPGLSGMDLLQHVRENYRTVDVILMTGHASVSTAVEAMKLGAYDYLTKPFSTGDLTNRVGRLVERRALVTENQFMREQLHSGSGLGGMIGNSPKMQEVYRLILRVAPRGQPVLITGESGTGKELAARAVHDCGENRAEPFVAVDCAALSATLIEGELFGHVAGAFTGAQQRRVGLLASAGKGTLFLDEIGELPPELQAKLLRAIQEREFRALGSNECRHFEARIVAATNRDLAALARDGRFRGDLFFRLNVLGVHLPPLRERRADIPILANAFLRRERRDGDAVTGISRAAMDRLLAFSWPGNVRELRNYIERALAVAEGPLIQPRDLGIEPEAAGGLSYLERLERQAIVEMLAAAGGNRVNAAKMLGLGKTTLYKKLKDYGLE